MIISYAWTTEALLAGRKKVTRRDWSREYAARFHAGTVHGAYDRLPRVHGKKVGDVVFILNHTNTPQAIEEPEEGGAPKIYIPKPGMSNQAIKQAAEEAAKGGKHEGP